MRYPMNCKSLLLSLALLPTLAQAELYITIVQGLSGMPAYQSEFDSTREKIVAASNSMTATERVSTFAGDAATREALLAHFSSLNTRMKADDRAAIYLIGHGSFDGEEYKFNIPGPDLSGSDFKQILADMPGQNHFLVATGSTSGAMVELIAGQAENPDYILVAATRNGNERNATHFGRFFAEALTNEAADINKNNNISIQEAFDFADRSVQTYFEEEGRLATEHAQLRGEGAAQFSLARVNQIQLETVDPRLNELVQQRQALDARIEELQLRRAEMNNADYLQQLQALILQSAEVSEQIEAEQRGATGGNQ
jgi:hypothetical protein